MNTQHTQAFISAITTGDRCELQDADGNVMAEVFGDDNDPQCWPMTANAKRLAMCWNCHDELLEALIKCKQAVENKDLPPSARMELVRDYATPAIQKATT